MTEARIIVARLLVALALIVQIVAPVRASVSMVAAATDPLAGYTICGHGAPSPADAPNGDACRLCDLVCHGAGFASIPPAPQISAPFTVVIAVLLPLASSEPLDEPTPRHRFARGPPTNA